MVVHNTNCFTPKYIWSACVQ